MPVKGTSMLWPVIYRLYRGSAPITACSLPVTRAGVSVQEGGNSLVKLYIDGQEVEVERGSTILDAARKLGIDIPTLCYLEDINELGVCRMCLVEIEGMKNLQTSCTYPATEGLKVTTNNDRIRQARRNVLQLLLSTHPQECLTCIRSGKCELQRLARELNVKCIPFEGERPRHEKDEEDEAIVREPEKCIHCRRCVAVCEKIQKVGALGAAGRGFACEIGPWGGKSISEVACIDCGQCTKVCPTAAVHEKENTEAVWAVLRDEKKHVVAMTAPSVRVALGEEFGMEPGTVVTGKMVAALRKLGFDRVFDVVTAADFTIVEEGHEFLAKLKNGGPFPHITSCSPGWVKFCEYFYPEFLPNLSTVKSPQAIMGTLIKTYYAAKQGIEPGSVVVVSVMPCTAKKFENIRPELVVPDGDRRNVDITITTRELARMIREAGINFGKLEDSPFDEPLGVSTGAGLIFGATGGVSEAALRSIYELSTGKELDKLEFHELRGMDGVKEVEVELPQGKVKVAVVHGTGNARKLLNKIKAGEVFYHFIEVMGCPGGCVAGGGQPLYNPYDKDVVRKRAAGLFTAEKGMTLRKSHENPVVKQIYREFLGEPLGNRAHRYLHTRYQPRARYAG